MHELQAVQYLAVQQSIFQRQSVNAHMFTWLSAQSNSLAAQCCMVALFVQFLWCRPGIKLDEWHDMQLATCCSLSL